MKDKEEIEIEGSTYCYVESYDRLEISDIDAAKTKIHVRCPKCWNGSDFSLTYGEWKIIANCLCGHSMTVYDG